jgi:predicted nucleic acid-binding protein
MTVVADAGPLHYLVLIGAVDVLGPLYGRVLAPDTVAAELRESNAPAAVRAWIADPPKWLDTDFTSKDGLCSAVGRIEPA